MKMSKRTVSALLLLVLLLSLCTAGASADGASTIQGNEKWNIMLVIDASGSMDHTSTKPSDPMGLRYYAVANFLGTLNDDSANVGAIAFTANYRPDDSDQAMASAIKCNTGLLPLSDGGTRDYIMQMIDPQKAYSLQDSDNNRGLDTNKGTDIGTALWFAYTTLRDAPQDGRRSAIFLFTDGETEVIPSLLGKSQENLQNALDGIRSDNMLLCGIYLNNGKPTNGANEIRRIVMDANSMAPSSLSINDRYIEINDARDCIDATDMFLRALGYSINDQSEIILSTTQKTFRVPGVGVAEATIRLYTVDGNTLPEGLNVSFQKPNGEWISGPAANALCFAWASSSKDPSTPQKLHSPISRVYKLKDPAPGEWTVLVEVPEGNRVEIHYSPSFSVNIAAEMETVPDYPNIHVNEDVTVNAYLTQNGQRLTDPRCYDLYECRFFCVDVNGTDFGGLLQFNGSCFTGTVNLKSYTTYYAHVEFTCDQVSADSPQVEWRLDNTPPQIVLPDRLVLRYGLFLPGERSFDLSPYALDKEDGTNLRFVLSGGSCNSAAVTQTSPEGPGLVLRAKDLGDGSLIFDVVDSAGAASQLVLPIVTRNMTPIYILLILAGLLAIAGTTVLILRRINRAVEGRCTLSFHVGDTLLMLEPPVPGTGDTKRKTDMLAIVNSVVRPDSDRIDSDKLDAVRAFVQEHAAALKAVKVSTAFAKIKRDFSGSKETVGLLQVKGKGLNVKLFNRSIRLVDDLFEFGFYPPEEELPIDDDYGGGYREGGEDGGFDGYSGGGGYTGYDSSGSYGGDPSQDSYGGSSDYSYGDYGPGDYSPDGDYGK